MSTALFILPRLYACEAGLELVQPAVETLLVQPSESMPVRLEFYRKYTEGMLRRYMRFSLATARVPSMLGREMFRGKVTSYKVHSFDDIVIFVHDVEQCLARLDRTQQLFILKIGVQEYTQEEIAARCDVTLKTVRARYNKALDALTAIFLEVKLLEPLKVVKGESTSKTPQVIDCKRDKTSK
jgi:hypothetical protein